MAQKLYLEYIMIRLFIIARFKTIFLKGEFDSVNILLVNAWSTRMIYVVEILILRHLCSQ